MTVTVSNTSCTAQGGSGGVLDHLTDTGSVPENAAPRPWRIVNGYSDICDRKGMFVAHVKQGVSGHVWPESHANARLIVEAVNSYAPSQARIRELESEVRQLRINNARLRDENICTALSRKDAL